MIGNVLTPTHLIVVLAIALLVLGPKRLPAAGRGLGEAMRGFKDALTSTRGSDDVISSVTPNAQPDLSTQSPTSGNGRPPAVIGANRLEDDDG